MSEEVPSAATDQSIEMRMRRWVKHDVVATEVTYIPFAQQILVSLADSPPVLAMDGSQVGRGCMVLMVGVVYRSRLLPLAWPVPHLEGWTRSQRFPLAQQVLETATQFYRRCRGHIVFEAKERVRLFHQCHKHFGLDFFDFHTDLTLSSAD